MHNQERIFLKECAKDEESFKKLLDFFEDLQRFRYLSDAGVDGVIIGRDGIISDANIAAASMLGYDKDEFIGQEVSRFVTTDSRDSVYKKFALKSENPYEVQGVHKNGSIIPLEVTGRHRKYNGKKYRISFMRDISRRKEIEKDISQSEAKSTAIIESTPDTIFAIDSQYCVTTFNTAFYNNVLTVYGKRLYIGIPLRDFIPKETFDSWKIQYDKAFLGERFVTFEFQFNYATGTSYREVSLSPILHDGFVKGVAVFGRDITTHKYTEEALKTSQSNISALIENTTDSIWSVDRNHRIITFNSNIKNSFLKTYGVHLRIGAHSSELVPGEVYEFWKALYDRTLNGERISFDHDYEENGQKHYIEISLNPILRDDEITGVAAFSKDVTQRRSDEEALKHSQASISALIENTSDAIFSIDREYRITAYNSVYESEFFKRFGKDLSLGISLRDVLPEETFSRWLPLYDRAFNGERFSFEFDIVQDGEVRFRETSLNPIFSGSTTIGLTAFGRDITERKREQEALKNSQASISALIENTTDSIWSVDRDYRLTAYNSVYNEIFFKRYGRDLKPGVLLRELVPEETFDQWVELYERAFKGEHFTFEYDFEANGTTIFREISLNPIISGDAITGVTSFGRDITQRKIYERVLKDSEANITALIENTDAAIWSVDNEYRVLAFNTVYNDVFLKRFGNYLSIGAVLGDLVPEETYKQWKPMYDRAFKGERFTFEFNIVQDGEVRFREVSLNPIFSGDTITGVTAFGRDITDRKRDEEALKTSRANLFALIENTRDFIWSVDSNMRLVTYNSAYEDMMFTLYRRKLFAGMELRSMGNAEEDNYWDAIYERALKGEIFSIKHKYTIGNGAVYAQVSFNPIMQDGRVTGIVGFSRNITEQQEIINEKNRLLETIQEHQEAMLRAVLDTQEQERSRISKDIHDGLGQILSAAKLTLRSTITEMQNTLSEAEADKAQYGITLLDMAVEEARSISREIMPSALMNFGLTAALEELFKTISAVASFKVQYYCHITTTIEKNSEIHIYRITQEMLNNIIKHAQATEVAVNIIEEDEFLTLMVEDNGVGFDLGKEMKKSTMGLKNIMNRANYLAAGINIDTRTGRGCTITLEIPVNLLKT